MTHFSLSDKVAVVTGASRGIGEAIALALAEAGADVVLAARSRESLEPVASKIRTDGRRALVVPTDVGKLADVIRLVEACDNAYGKLDILVNSAGISPIYKRPEKVTEEEWDQIVDVNMKGLFFCCQEAGKVMIRQKRGKIINIASVAGLVALPRLIAYSASKGGVVQITKGLAVEWAEHNIQVNAIAPGWVATEFTKGLRDNPAIADGLMEKTPARRFGEPTDMAGAALYLASEASNYCTGSVLSVDGGWTAW